MATAQREPSQIQKDLLARRLVESDFEPRPGRPDRSEFHLPEAEELYDSARPRPERPDRSEYDLPEAGELCDAARTRPRPGRLDRSDVHLPKVEELHDVARCQLCEVARVNLDFELQNAARATALSPSVKTGGQRVSPPFADDFTVREAFADDFTIWKGDAVGL